MTSEVVDPQQLIAELVAAGYQVAGVRTGGYTRLARPGDLHRGWLLVPEDRNAPEFEDLMTAVLTTLQDLARAGSAAGRVLAAVEGGSGG